MGSGFFGLGLTGVLVLTASPVMALQGVSNSPCMEASAATRMAAEAVLARSGSERSSRGKRTNALVDFRMSCMASRRQHPCADW